MSALVFDTNYDNINISVCCITYLERYDRAQIYKVICRVVIYGNTIMEGNLIALSAGC